MRTKLFSLQNSRQKLLLFLFTIASFLCYLTVHHFAFAQQAYQKKIVYTFELKQEIAPAAARLVHIALNEAEEQHADVIIMQLNTFGGALDAADEIRNIILKSKIPVYVLIDGNAASAGALISIACNKIYMKKGSTLGAASVVNQNGEIMPDKYQSYMRGMMRATAEQRGRDPKIAEGMVTPNAYLKDIADSGKIITLTSDEAIRYHYCDGVAEDIVSVCSIDGITNYEQKNHEPSLLDLIISFLLNPIVNSILLMIIIGGIYFEFQHPGIGFPLFAGLGAAILYFAPLYLDGLAANWEILVFVIGIILLITEIFFIPGFGITGVLGVIFIVTSLALALIGNNFFDFSYTGVDALLLAVLRVGLILFFTIISAFYFGPKIFSTSLGRKVVLTSTLEDAKSFSTPMHELLSLIGRKGIARTDLRPSGNVEIDGRRYDCISENSFVHIGEEVSVIEVRGNYLVVRKN